MAPDRFRERLRGLSTKRLVAAVVRLRPSALPETLKEVSKVALRSVARRHRALSEEIAQLDMQLERLVAEVAPGMLALLGVSKDHSATLLVVAGDNPERLKSEASFASLCGASPIEVSSGKVVRHRLNRGGNRDANRALHLTCVVRMRYDWRTKLYVARRTAEGKSKRDHRQEQRRHALEPRHEVLRNVAQPIIRLAGIRLPAEGS